MTARKRYVRLTLRYQSRSYAWAPKVCPDRAHSVGEHAVATRPGRLARLDRTFVVTTLAPTPDARTIQRP